MNINFDAMVVQNLLEYKANNNADKFFEEVKKFLPRLRTYIDQRLHIEERKGNIPQNFYKADDILDEVILDIYNKISSECTEDKLKQELYRKAIEKINSIVKQDFVKKVDIENLINHELNDLNEKITVNADGELILTEELDDISYHQRDYQQYIFTDTAIEDNLLLLLDKKSEDKLSDSHRRIFWRLYNLIPENSKLIVELHLFAGLTSKEIANIIGTTENAINKVLSTFSEKLNKLLK